MPDRGRCGRRRVGRHLELLDLAIVGIHHVDAAARLVDREPSDVSRELPDALAGRADVVEERAGGREDVNVPVGRVRHVDPTAGIHPDPVDVTHLSGVGRRSP